LVTAPETIRINRVKKRDQLTEFEIRNRMKNQWSDHKKSLLADSIIENIELKQTEDAVNQMHLFLLKSL
jgi:dephospho-CoA kinase